MINNIYTFSTLMEKYKKIEIPIIQRDYAQGRNDDNIPKIRKLFLKDLFNAITKESIPLDLDFVYGSEKNNILFPLDGQQRLTTLFLLHWYLSVKKNHIDKETKHLEFLRYEKENNLYSKFSYETRISSGDFCNELINFSLDFSKYNIDSLQDVIMNQYWFRLSWIKDPTIKSMLVMLDDIHKQFKGVPDNCFDNLKNDNVVTFRFLPLDEFNLTDELYIKMNARGKPLTNYENFKAKLEPYLILFDKENDLKDEFRTVWKIDNNWSDIFWEMAKENENPKIDKNILRFFINLTHCFHMESLNKPEQYKKEIADKYDIFSIYKKFSAIPNELDRKAYIEKRLKDIGRISRVLDSLGNYEDLKDIFKIFINDDKRATLWEMARFYALTLFLDQGYSLSDDFIKLKRWMRITINLINNKVIDNIYILANTIQDIKKLSENLEDIYIYTASEEFKNNGFGFRKEQVEDEHLKSELINQDAKWEDAIIKYENHPYFYNQIGFLINLSDKNYASFLLYASKCAKLFDKDFHNNNFIREKALLVQGNYLVEDTTRYYSFCIYDTTENPRYRYENWRKVFNDSQKQIYLKKLLKQIDITKIYTSLEIIIKESIVDDWRKYFIETTPELIHFMNKKRLRWKSEQNIKLMHNLEESKRTKELYSYVLYERLKVLYPNIEFTYQHEKDSSEFLIIFEINLKNILISKDNDEILFDINITDKDENILLKKYNLTDEEVIYSITENIKITG